MTLSRRHIRFSRDLLLSAGFVVLLAVVFAGTSGRKEQADRASDLRTRSFLLADELRQSSDDLTRMVRVYVATSNPVYKKNFQDILDIRNGTKPRPEDHWRPYWDLKLSGGPAPRPDSRQTIALLELMRQSGFSEEEFRKLAEAKANSDALTVLEFEAMSLIESGGSQTAVHRAQALGILHDDNYHRAKASIMKPIDDFILLTDQRTLAAVESARTYATALRYLIIGIGLGLMCLLWRTYSDMRGILGAPLERVHAEIIRIGSGDFSSTLQPKAGQENSVQGQLSAMRARLLDLDQERRQYEGKLATIAGELEVKVASRTGELALALEAATESDRSKSDFMANVTHELRTPLNSVIGFAELLKEQAPGPLNPRQSEFVVDILASGQRLLALVDAILEVSRLDATGAPLESEPVEIGAAIAERMAAHRKAADVRGVTMRMDVAPDTGSLDVNPTALRRMLDALLDNATKFNREGGTVRVSAHRVGRALEIAVADTGIGISAEALSKLDGPLTQLDTGRARQRGGIGLGLTLARRMVRLVGGTLEVASELSQGSTFTLRLPTGAKP